METYSALMSVYQKEKPEYLRQSIQSMLQQTIPPSEFVVVRDGPLTTELDAVLQEFPQLKQVTLETNQGLGKALARGLKECNCTLVARMDSDDIALADRCQKQLKAFECDPLVDVVGGQVLEFIDGDETSKYTQKPVPITMEEILSYARRRNPLNHMTVMFRKEAVIQAGNYQDCSYFEDYDLWIRMIQKGYKICNLPDVLVLMRIPATGYSRRGGIKYARCILRFYHRVKETGFLTRGQCLGNCILRLPIALLPNWFRNVFYHRVIRRSIKSR